MANRPTELKYLIVNDLDRQFGLWVNTVGFQSIPAGVAYPLREHPADYFFDTSQGRVLHEYQLVYIARGQGRFAASPAKEQPIGQGSLIVLLPGQWHTYQPDTATGWDEYYIGFEGPVVDKLLADGFLSADRQVLEIGMNAELVGLFARALEIAEADRIAAQQYLAGIVLHTLGLLLSVSKNQSFEAGDMDQKIEQAKILMGERIYGQIDAHALAAQLGLSYSLFRKSFKAYTGYSPTKYFQELKIVEAKRLLVSTSLSVKEIIFKLGYVSAEHFFILFKQRTGLTPLEYRLSASPSSGE